MQKINPLLDQASKKLEKDSSRLATEVGQSNTTLDSSGLRANERGMDHIDAINQVFAEFEFAYHNQFHKAFADLESLTIAKKYWLSNVEEYSPSHIVAAGKKLIKSREYLPSIAAFLMECEKGYELFGLPSVRAAYAEVCGASSPKASHNWSHEAVYLAGKATGWFLLANESEKNTFPLFEFNYVQLVKKVMTGQNLMVMPPIALKEKVDSPTSKRVTKERLTKLRGELGL